MNDLIERLRYICTAMDCCNDSPDCCNKERQEAADALEAKDQEIERLEQSDQVHREQRDNWKAAYDKAEARVAELEIALREIIDEDDSWYRVGGSIAKKALGDK